MSGQDLTLSRRRVFLGDQGRPQNRWQFGAFRPKVGGSLQCWAEGHRSAAAFWSVWRVRCILLLRPIFRLRAGRLSSSGPISQGRQTVLAKREDQRGWHVTIGATEGRLGRQKSESCGWP